MSRIEATPGTSGLRAANSATQPSPRNIQLLNNS
jgi:hypothetical protein